MQSQASDGIASHAAEQKNVRSEGALGDGKADDSLAVQAAYDRLVAEGGGTLYFPKGIYRVNLRLNSRLVHLNGQGQGVSTLLAADRKPVVRGLFADASWNPVLLSNLSIVGAPGGGNVGFACGEDKYARSDEYVGRVIFQRVGFSGFRISIARPYGNIGFTIDDCTFEDADFHLWTESNNAPGDPMHGGILNVRRTRFTGFRKAMFYIDSRGTPGGQINFEDCVIENAPGFVIYIRQFDGAGGTPGIRMARTWNEATATGRNIELGGKTHMEASFLHASKCTAPIVLDDTPVGNMVLRDAQVTTHACSLDLLKFADIDRRSQLFHSNARMFSGTAPGLCRSIDGPASPAGLRTPWFRMPLPGERVAGYGVHELQLWDATMPRPFVGSARQFTENVEGDAALPGARKSQRLFVKAGQQFWLEPLFDVPSVCWVVIQYIVRNMSGVPIAIQLNGSEGLSGATSISDSEWHMLVGVAEMPARLVKNVGVMHSVVEGQSELRIGGLSVLAFPSRQSAISFVNRCVFPL